MNRISRIPAKTSLMFIILMIISFQPLPAGDQPTRTFVNNPIIATVDSEPFQITDIENKQLNEVRHQLFELLTNQLKKAAIKKLADKYPRYNKKANVVITDRETKAFYEANNLASRGSYEQLYPMIKQVLKQRVESDLIDGLYDLAIKEKLIISYLELPNDFLIKVPIETAHLRGNKQAKVMLLEFSDYQCPFCARVQPTISSLRNRYEKEVVFGYRHAPLPFHREADEAAIAAECVREQGKFAEYHDLLFKNPANLFIPDLKSYARSIKIKNQKQFNQCLDSEKYRPRLERDLEAATEAGIRGAPGFIIGLYDQKTRTVSGEIISGAQPQSVFVNAIEKYLIKTR
jgi:protein-disulfide isomerase